jgi:hypothetical protein
VLAITALLASCGGGGDSASLPPVETEVIAGRVFDGTITGAIVCIDLNGNGRCDQGESRASTDAAGKFSLEIPKGSTAALVAEVVAGTASDSDLPGVKVDASYRMASPSQAYSKDITPFTTLVHLAGDRNFPLAEDIVRNELGLPAKFSLVLDPSASPDTLTRSVARSVVSALKKTDASVGAVAAGTLDAFVASLPAELTTLPTLKITTKDGAPIVSKEDYVDATFELTNFAVSPQPVKLNGKIRGRGHTTWGQPKNPYKVQFSNDASYAAVPDVLGMLKSRNWALLADYFDRSLMRNKLALTLGSSSVFADGLKWGPVGQHVEVTLNGDYVGVYLLTEDIRIAAERLNIKKMSSSATVNDVDGGYIVEADWRLDCYNQGNLNLQFVSAQGIHFCIDTPDEEAITQNQLAYIKDLIARVESDLYGGAGLSRINAVSFVDFYLISELFRNTDANFWSSVFMWKDTAAATDPRDRLVNLGPLWDFDRSAGNVNYYDNWKTEGCWVARPGAPELSNNPNWFPKLFENPEFLNLTLARWKQKRPALERFVNASVDTYARRLNAAQQRNFTRWPIFGVPLTNYYVFANYGEEVAFVKRFLNERMAWLDRAYESPASFAAMCK